MKTPTQNLHETKFDSHERPARCSLTVEYLLTIVSVALGLIVAAVLSPKDSSFLPNVLFYWGPHICVLVIFGLYRPPQPAAFAGVAIALAVYLAVFGAWVFSRSNPESMTWLGYIFSFPGALVGALLARVWIFRHQVIQPFSVVIVVAPAVLFGIAANQAIVCTTVMYCKGMR
ncbi:hypothetical protein [Polaromonas sp. YR568]|uniref:hypothetical protein n=1 Tax=Polaromonas sp. YR568 TaxID=1855301 RepID=UPI00398BDEC5